MNICEVSKIGHAILMYTVQKLQALKPVGNSGEERERMAQLSPGLVLLR